MMLHVPGVLLREPGARASRHALDAADWVDGRDTVGQQGAQVKHNRQLPETSPVGRELGKGILAALEEPAVLLGRPAAALCAAAVQPLRRRRAYGLHVDGAMRAVPGTGLRLRTDLSCTLFLCEPEDYDGGELEVVDTYGTHEVKLPAGDLILYPSSSLHRVQPVTRGARVCSFFWVQSMVRDDAQRAMLFELDQRSRSCARRWATARRRWR